MKGSSYVFIFTSVWKCKQKTPFIKEVSVSHKFCRGTKKGREKRAVLEKLKKIQTSPPIDLWVKLTWTFSHKFSQILNLRFFLKKIMGYLIKSCAIFFLTAEVTI